MNGPDKHTAMPIATPPPPVEEGITAGKPRLGWVRGYGLRDCVAEATPHPSPLRGATLSHKVIGNGFPRDGS
jgi:hypothetical protein